MAFTTRFKSTGNFGKKLMDARFGKGGFLCGHVYERCKRFGFSLPSLGAAARWLVVKPICRAGVRSRKERFAWYRGGIQVHIRALSRPTPDRAFAQSPATVQMKFDGWKGTPATLRCADLGIAAWLRDVLVRRGQSGVGKGANPQRPLPDQSGFPEGRTPIRDKGRRGWEIQEGFIEWDGHLVRSCPFRDIGHLWRRRRCTTQQVQPRKKGGGGGDEDARISDCYAGRVVTSILRHLPDLGRVF